MIRPPSHRVDALPIVVSEHDTAWNREKIQAELAAMGDDAIRHPFMQYHAGSTRYDIGAEIQLPDGTSKPVTDYLDLAQAWQFHCRRLTGQEVYRLQPMLKANELLAYWEALRITLIRIEGPGAPKVDRDVLGEVSNETIDTLYQIASNLPAEIGQAVMIASKPLSPAEKKA